MKTNYLINIEFFFIFNSPFIFKKLPKERIPAKYKRDIPPKRDVKNMK